MYLFAIHMLSAQKKIELKRFTEELYYYVDDLKLKVGIKLLLYVYMNCALSFLSLILYFYVVYKFWVLGDMKNIDSNNNLDRH